MPSETDLSLAVLTGKEAPGPLHLLNELLGPELDAASDALYDALQQVVVARQALNFACGPGTVERVGDTESWTPGPDDRYKASAASAAQLQAAHQLGREAVKGLRELASATERAAALTAAQLGRPHLLPDPDLDA